MSSKGLVPIKFNWLISLTARLIEFLLNRYLRTASLTAYRTQNKSKYSQNIRKIESSAEPISNIWIELSEI